MSDWLTSATQYFHLADVYLQTERAEQAKPLFAKAYHIYSQVGSPYADITFQRLSQACGSEEAANAYLATRAQGSAVAGGARSAEH